MEYCGLEYDVPLLYTKLRVYAALAVLKIGISGMRYPLVVV
jgi:hypothetical protein